MAFSASKVVESLRYDLRPYVEAHGQVPEPTDDELRLFNSKQREAMRAVTGEDFDPTDQTAVVRAFSKLTDYEIEAMDDASLENITAICKGHPTREQLVAAGPRVRREFTKWLNGELNGSEESGEGSRSATKR